jgi:transposase InsO family protein
LGGSRGRLVSAQDRLEAIKLVNEACTNGARQYKACEVLDVSIRTLERWVHEQGTQDKRKNAERTVGNKLTQDERMSILTTINSKDYQDLPPCKIVPMLADNGIYLASESTMYRILREENQLTHRQLSRSARHHRPKACVANAANQVWSWDITYLSSQVRGEYFYLYMIVDIFSRKVVGWSIHEEQSADYASKLIKQACIDENINRNQIILHSDNGAPMKGSTMLATLQTLGVAPSFSRPSVSDDNPFSESLFKTLKYHTAYPKIEKFQTIESSRQWCIRFVDWYNNQHLHSGLKFITPNQRHCGDDKKTMSNRHKVYQLAKQQHPERWSSNTRNWTLPDSVTLNPDRKKKENHADNEMVFVRAA